MRNKKRVIVLVSIAIVLAIIAIAINTNESSVSTTGNSISGQENNGGNIGIYIEPPQVEDRLAQEALEQNG